MLRRKRRQGKASLLWALTGLLFILSSCHSSKQLTTTTAYSSHAPSQRPTASAAERSQPTAQLDHISKSRKKLLKTTYAKMLGVSAGKIKNYRLYEFIDEWYGVHYKLGGTDQSGVDCSGFAQQLYKNVYGVNLVRTSGQQYKSSRHRRRQRRLREGDLVFFSGGGEGISHVGVYLRNGYFVHSATSKGVMISNLKETYWKRAYASGGKIRK